MTDSCYVCRRTQADLDRLNEEIRTKVYLSYFSNARNQIDEQQQRFTFLERLKDEEGGDPHFRIKARQVFGDPEAYEKLMPWVNTLMGIIRASDLRSDEEWTIGELVDALLTEERRLATAMEHGLNQLRAGFAREGRSPLALEPATYVFPVDWSVEGFPFPWRGSQVNEAEPLSRQPGESKATVEVPLHLCSVCRKLTGN
jgi:hypothetical protein